MTRLRIALVQADTAWHAPAVNRAKARLLIVEAATAGARLVVLPEMFATGFTMEAGRFAESIPGETSDALAALAVEHGVHVVGTAIERHGARPRNAAFCIAPDGSIAAIYRKIHPFTAGDEPQHYDAGTECPVFAIDGVPAVMQICYDLRFPEPLRAAAAAGAELAIVPANWPAARIAHWSTLLAARAIENQMVVCGVNRAGSDPSHGYPGASAIHDARGEIVARAGDGERVLVADVDFGAVRAWRAAFPALSDRRPAVYRTLER